jgi:surface polysaccharide O-acyltransferase-like enzyme
MNFNSKNLTWLHLLRVAAAAAVVILHVSAVPVVFIQDRSSALWNAGNIFDSLSRWCIGIFIMVSGALLLDPSRAESTASFFVKRARRILIPIIFWSALFIGVSAIMGERLTLTKVTRLIWEGRPWYHMWYLFMIIGLYAVTPVLRVFVARASTALRWTTIVLALALASAWDLQLSIESRSLPAILPTMFIPYLGYYLAGYDLRRLAPVPIHSGLLWGAFGFGALITIAGTHALLEKHGTTRLGLFLYEYLSPNVILMSFSIFCLASKTKAVGPGSHPISLLLTRFVTWAGPLTLGIYMWHPLVILELSRHGFTAIGSGNILGVLFIALPAFVASLALTWSMSKIPLLRQTVGLR